MGGGVWGHVEVGRKYVLEGAVVAVVGVGYRVIRLWRRKRREMS